MWRSVTPNIRDAIHQMLMRCNLFIRFLNKKYKWISIAIFKPLTRGMVDAPVLRKHRCAKPGLAAGKCDWWLHKTNNALLNIYSLIDLNQTNSSYVLTHAGTSRKPRASYIIDQRETRLMPWCRPKRKANNDYTTRDRGKLKNWW